MPIQILSNSIQVKTEKLADGSWTWRLVDLTGSEIRTGRLGFLTRELAEQTGAKQAQLERLSRGVLHSEPAMDAMTQ